MKLFSSSVMLGVVLYNCARADVAHLSPAKSYIFSYQGGPAPGHVDRQHTEVSDGSGVVRGAYSYIDPMQQIHNVQYAADANGYNSQNSRTLSNEIAQVHADAAQASSNAAHAHHQHNPHNEYNQNSQPYQHYQHNNYNPHQQAYNQDLVRRTKDYVGDNASEAVFRATLNHFYEYDRAVNADTEARTAAYAAQRNAYDAALRRS